MNKTLKENEWDGWNLLENKIVDYIVFRHEKENYCNLFAIIDNCRVRLVVDLDNLNNIINEFNWIKNETYNVD